MSGTSKVSHFDVLIVGAGLSGIGAAYHLQQKSPGKSYAILEGRSRIGGTWDLFRYPGIRSDSDMHTLGYSFKPWVAAKSIADGPSILDYVKETASENGIDEHIIFNQQVVKADWASEKSKWTVISENPETGQTETRTCQFLLMCSGYYNYAAGYTPDFDGADTFKGEIVHPQKWTDDIDHSGKNVVIIGSGATAVTLVPEMAKTARHVTMLQRSPTYIVSRPAEDKLANRLRGFLPAKLAYSITRWKNVLFQMFFYNLAQKHPEKTKERLVGMVREELGPDYDVGRDFTPTYNPWDQRLCLVPDSDLFNAIKSGDASVVTDHIDRFNETGIQLKSGKHIEADMIVTATGLNMQFLSDVQFNVDGRDIVPNELLNYKGLMYSGVPNMASVFGYTNASWTLKADLTSEYMCRLLNHMDRLGVVAATPTIADESVETEEWLSFSSGYVQRAMQKFPRQATEGPWKLHQNYAKDMFALRFGKLDDGVLKYTRKGEPVPKSKTAGSGVSGNKAAHDQLRSTNTVPAE